MAIADHRMWRDPAFRVGLLIRIVFIALLVPEIQGVLFVPFVEHAILNPAWDPWSAFLAAGGDPTAYPYGPVMLLAHLPGTALGVLADALSGSTYWGGVGFRLGLLAADFAALLLISRLFPGQMRRLLWLYWLSPIVLFVTYWHGQSDIVPVALLLWSLLLIRRHQAATSGIALGLALAAKYSMILALPFVGLYLWRNKPLRSLLRPFVLGFGATAVVLLAPWLLSSGFALMVLGTPESLRVYDLALPLGESQRLYLTPLLYMLALYGVWRFRRLNFELLIAAIGLAFFLVVLATPAPPGWYLWLVPFLVAHQLQSDRRMQVQLLVGGFSAMVVGLHLVRSSGAEVPLLGLRPSALTGQMDAVLSAHVLSLGYTVIIATGLVLLVQMLRERVARNDYYRIGQRPVTIGVAGDSGSGKDTLSMALAGIFGWHSVVHLSGDDYHVWDRYAPMWKGLTHLNPRANDLQRFSNDVLSLMDGRAILLRRYDHAAGRFRPAAQLNKNDIILVSGLHALHSDRLRQRYDVSIYLDVDEELRRAWKIHRDVQLRGHDPEAVSSSLERRAPDAKLHIHPQKEVAGLVLRLVPVNGRQLRTAASPHDVRLRLLALIRNGMSHERMARILIGICGLHVDIQPSENGKEVELSIEGDVAAEDIALAARTLVPGLQEMLDIEPKWESGMTGIMQLLVLIQIEESLTNRIT